MKKTLLTVALVAATVAAFAQGKIQVQNDGSRLVTITVAGPGDPLGPVSPASTLPGTGVSLVLGLYAGTASTALSLVSTYPVNPDAGSVVAGQIASSHCVLPFAGGSPDFFEVKVWESAYASYEAQVAVAGLAGYLSQGQSVFTMTPGTSIAYPGINNGGGTTWAAAPINVAFTPEPSTFALAGLGAAALMIFRRRKQ